MRVSSNWARAAVARARVAESSGFGQPVDSTSRTRLFTSRWSLTAVGLFPTRTMLHSPEGHILGLFPPGAVRFGDLEFDTLPGAPAGSQRPCLREDSPPAVWSPSPLEVSRLVGPAANPNWFTSTGCLMRMCHRL